MRKKRRRGVRRVGGYSKIRVTHSVIDDLLTFLQSIEKFPEVTGIVPGPMESGKGDGSFRFRVQFQDISGLRCIAKSKGFVQVVYINTSQPKVVWEKIDELTKG